MTVVHSNQLDSKHPKIAVNTESKTAKQVKEKELGETGSHPQQRIGELEAQVREMTELVQHVQAEFENYQKRVAREKGALQEQEKARVVLKMLPFIETLGKAVEHSIGEEKAGLEALEKQFWKLLEGEHLKPMGTLLQPFDPSIHECVSKVHDPAQPDHIVIEEIQKGFWLNAKLLRPAKVVVNQLENETGELP